MLSSKVAHVLMSLNTRAGNDLVIKSDKHKWETAPPAVHLHLSVLPSVRLSACLAVLGGVARPRPGKQPPNVFCMMHDGLMMLH